MSVMTFFRHVVLGALLALNVSPSALLAQAADQELAQRMAKEKADRRDCKIKVCDTALNRKADGDDIACKFVKTWTAVELKEKILKGRFDWPFGNVQCTGDVKLARKPLATVLAGGEVEAKLDKHSVSCTLDQKDGKDKYSISFSIQPVVKFKDGKAIKASINWSDIQGSAVAKGALWSTATLDNYTGVLNGIAVESVNDYFGPHCDEVKSELGKK
jgi:hypothetical protein